MNTLELANALEVSDKHPELINVNNRAAAELRRLHEENEWLMSEIETILTKQKERLIKARGERK